MSRTLARLRRPPLGVAAFLVLIGVLVGFRLLGTYPWNEYVFDLQLRRR